MEWRLFDGDTAYVSTLDFHRDRERAPHLEQGAHRERLLAAAELVRMAVNSMTAEEPPSPPDRVRVVDLGCGDGGLMSLLREPHLQVSGYDFQPSNAAGWVERGVTATALDFVADWAEVVPADVYVITECLEHLTDPHEMLARIWRSATDLVCSSPWTETYESHDACHAWAWDQEGYAAMVEAAGFSIQEHRKVGMFQLIWATP